MMQQATRCRRGERLVRDKWHSTNAIELHKIDMARALMDLPEQDLIAWFQRYPAYLAAGFHPEEITPELDEEALEREVLRRQLFERVT